MKKVLIITSYYPPMGGPGCIKLVKHLKYMRDSGWEPVIITPRDTTFFAYDESMMRDVEGIRKYTFTNPDIGWLKSKLHRKAPKQEDRRWLAEKGKTSLSQTIQRFIWRNLLIPDGRIGWVWPLYFRAKQIIAQEKPDLIYVRLPVWSMGIAARRIARSTSLPLVVDFDDEWTGDFNDFIEHPAFRKRIERRMEARIVRQANIVLATTPAVRDNFRSRYPDQPADKFRFVTMGFDPDDFTDMKPDRGDTDNDTFLLTFLGTFHHKVEPVGFFITPIFIFRALQMIKQQHPERRIHFRIVGHLIEHLRHLVDDYDIADMLSITGYQPHERAMELTKGGDALLLVLYSKGRGNRHLPAKMFEYIAMERPILTLACAEADAWKVVDETGLGLRADPENEIAIMERLLELHDGWLRGESAVTPNPEGIANYQQQRKTAALMEIFEGLT